jgi:hypothetical protein
LLGLGGSLVVCGGPSFTTAGDAAADGGGGGGGDSGGSSGGASDSGSGSSGASDGSSGGPADSGATEASSPWTPAMLPGLVLWLDDTAGVVQSSTTPGVVTGWLDQSGRVNNAAPTNTQAGTDFTLDQAVLNGYDAIVCPGNGTWLNIPDGPTVQFGTGDFGLVSVAKYGTDQYIWAKIDPSGGGAGLDFGYQGGDFVLVPGYTNRIALTNNAPASFHIVAGRGAALRLVADAQTTTGPVNTADLTYAGPGVHVCQQVGTGTYNTELAELIAVKGTLSDADLARTTAYLKSKFNL